MKSNEFLDELSKIGNDPGFENDIKADKIKKKKKQKIAVFSAAGALALVLAAAIIVTSIPLGKPGKIEFPDPEPIVFNEGNYSGRDPSLPKELEGVRISADGKRSGTISVDSSFIVETSGETNAETLAQYLTVTPAVSTSVTKLSSTSFKVTPSSGSLAPGQIYRLTLGDPGNPAVSYAFQTESALAISSMFPGDRTVNVPVNTGIEVTFSEAVVIDANAAPFTISPAVGGAFSVYPDGKTVLFRPSSGLEYDTVYTVTVNGGVKGKSGRTFEGTKTAVFRTFTKEYERRQGSSGYDYLYVHVYNPEKDLIFSPGQTAGFDVVAQTNTGNTPKITCDLYAFNSAKQAASVLIDYEKRSGDHDASVFDYSGLTKIGSYSATDNPEMYNAVKTFDFGNKLAAGTYVAKVTSSAAAGFGKVLTDELAVIIQVSDMRVFTLSSDGRSYVWVNSTKQGPLDGADLAVTRFNRFDGWNSEEVGATEKIKTDSSGIASFDSSGCDSAVILVENGPDAAVICASVLPGDTYDYFMNYIFTDRDVYFSDDTVNFSGYIKHSFGGKIPDRLCLRTGLSSLKTPVDVDENGFFSGSFSFSHVSSGYYTLSFTDESGRSIAAKAFTVTEESKPQYTASLTFDKLFYRRGEEITVTLTAAFFDGTPAEGLEFGCRMNYFGTDIRTATTDKNGKASFTYTPRDLSANEVYGTDHLTLTCRAELTNYETQRLYVTASAPYFHSDYVVGTGADEKASYMTLNLRDTSKLKTAEDLSWKVFPGNTVGEPLTSGSFSYTLQKYVVVKSQKTRYDSYTKRTVKYYEYSVRQEQVNSGRIPVSNGIAEFPLMEVSGFEGYYIYEITFYDDTSRNTFNYSLNGTAGKNKYSDLKYGRSSLSPTILLNNESYSLNDTVEAEVWDPSGAQNALFAVFGDGIEKIEYASNISFKYTNSMIPGGRLYAVVFDPVNGTYVKVSVQLQFDTARAALAPEITASSDKYRPGDRAVVNIKVPGASGGFAVVSVVDEACFALGDQTLEPSAFFRSSVRAAASRVGYYYYYYGGAKTPSIILNQRFVPVFTLSAGFNSMSVSRGNYYAGSEPEAVDAPAGDYDNLSDGEPQKNENADAGYYVRQYFADNPVYSVVELDEDGCGTLVFTVPDNITSWRISALAFSGAGKENGELRIGSSVSDVICTQPFFINIGICEQYIVGDTVSLSVRSYGSEANGKVNYTAVLCDTLGNETDRVSGSADSKDRCWLKFDLDKPGRYRVTVYANCGKASDAATADFDLVTTAVAADVSKTISVSELKNISPVYYPVRLVFTNRTPSFSLYERIAGILSFNRGSGRTDEYIALYAASAAREKLYGESSADEQEDLMRMITENFDRSNGLFRTFPYSEADPKLTASILALGLPLDSSFVAKTANVCRTAVASEEQESPEVLIANIVSLAAVGEPVLDTLYSVADKAANYSAEAKLWLALGFALCGDYPAAYDVYSMVKADIGSEDEEHGTLKFEARDFDTTVSLSCLALLNASRIARDDAAKLAVWLSENRSDISSDRIALAGYLKYFLPAEAGETMEFTYSIGETTENVSLTTGRSFMLTLSEKELDMLKLNLPDDAKVGVYCRGRSDEALSGGTRDESRITVTKSLEQNYRGNCVVTLRIKGTSTRVSEYFELYDLIPSGARFLSMESGGSSYVESGNVRVYAYIYNRSGQHMSGSVGIYNKIYANDKDRSRVECPKYSFDISVSYVIRGAVEGDFIAESAYVRNTRTGVFSLSERLLVTIGGDHSWFCKEVEK